MWAWEIPNQLFCTLTASLACLPLGPWTSTSTHNEPMVLLEYGRSLGMQPRRDDPFALNELNQIPELQNSKDIVEKRWQNVFTKKDGMEKKKTKQKRDRKRKKRREKGVDGRDLLSVNLNCGPDKIFCLFWDFFSVFFFFFFWCLFVFVFLFVCLFGCFSSLSLVNGMGACGREGPVHTSLDWPSASAHDRHCRWHFSGFAKVKLSMPKCHERSGNCQFSHQICCRNYFMRL